MKTDSTRAMSSSSVGSPPVAAPAMLSHSVSSPASLSTLRKVCQAGSLTRVSFSLSSAKPAKLKLAKPDLVSAVRNCL